MGIIGIFADCKCEKDSKDKPTKFIEPFPPGTEKAPYVPYIKEENSTGNANSEVLKAENFEERVEDTCENLNEKTDEKNIIQIQVQLDEGKTEAKYFPQKQQVAVAVNPYDIPDDF